MKRISFIVCIICLVIQLNAQKIDTVFVEYNQKIPEHSFTFKMIPIKAGSFFMGSPLSQKERGEDEGPQKNITLDAFWMGAYEVTHDEYNSFFQDNSFTQNTDADAITRPSQPYIDFTLNMGKDGGFPANSMQQYGALMYCKWLYKKTGIFFRLPTEAEWEYACRAGNDSKYPFGNNENELQQYAWFAKNSDGVYHKVGQLKPNAWGLYDMLGNVGEWVLDQYDEKYFTLINKNNKNPTIIPTKRYPRSVRGGTFKDPATELRPANRRESESAWNRRDPQIPKSKWWNADAPFIGFRIVRPFIQPSAIEIEQFFDLYLIK